MTADSVARVRSLGDTFAVTQWLTPSELQLYQAARACRLLKHARKTTKYYKNRFDVDLDQPAALGKIWSDFPIITRREAVENRLNLFARKMPPESGPARDGKTSGSTGAPFKFKRSAMMDVAATAMTERMMGWWSVDGSKSHAVVANDSTKKGRPPEGITTEGWHSKHPNGLRHFLAATTDVDVVLQWLLLRQPRYLSSYPPVLKELALNARQRSLALKFDLVFGFATVLDIETRDLVRSAFGAEIAETYGSEEAGHLAAQCPDCGELHVSAESVIVEILRPDGSPASDGEFGRVVVTPLYNYAMPLIRYELGDWAERGSAVPACGRGLPALRRILGRTRNMLRFRDGTVVWPVTGSFRIPDFISLKQYQIVQTDLDRLEIRYVPADADRPVDLPALTQRIRTVLRQPVEIAVRSVAQIDRSASGKYEECISVLSENQTR